MTQIVLVVAIVAIAVVLIVSLFLGRKVAAEIGNIHLELSPNGSKSVKDRVELIYQIVTDQSAITREHGERIAALELRPTEHHVDRHVRRSD
jgi:hypothetical protein